MEEKMSETDRSELQKLDFLQQWFLCFLLFLVSFASLGFLQCEGMNECFILFKYVHHVKELPCVLSMLVLSAHVQLD